MILDCLTIIVLAAFGYMLFVWGAIAFSVVGI